MRWVGEGSELWRVRVDLFAPTSDGSVVSRIHETLGRLLIHSDERVVRGDVGVDQGTGAAGDSVVGMLFWVRADDVGDAARLAVDIAQRAAAVHDVGPQLYDVTVIPIAAVVSPEDPSYPRQPD